VPTERLNLPGGDWVDLASRVNHAQHRRIRSGYGSAEKDTITETAAALVTNWSVRDVDGADIPFPGAAPDGVTSESLDKLPHETVLAMFTRAAELFHGGPVPNASAGTSGESPPPPA